MSRTWIGAVAALLAALCGLLVPQEARAAERVVAATPTVTPSTPTVTPTTTTSGDEMTVFRGTGDGFAPGSTVEVSVKVDSGSGSQQYAGAYTTAHRTDSAGSFSWAWVWTQGDPYGSYTISFSQGATQLGVGLNIRHSTAAPRPAEGTDLMVDTASAPTVETMRSWLGTAPYDAIAAYIPVDPAVDDRHDKDQANLDASWVRTVQAGGWRVVPVYVGLQVPTICQNPAGAFHPMSTDPAVAQAQGVTAAADAVFAANGLGIDASAPVVYDLESYRPGCRDEVQAFLLGWTAELHRLHRSAAVYGGATSAAADLAAAATADPAYMLPDVFWAATDNRKAAASVANLPASGWKVANQFILGVERTYGDASATVDESAVDEHAWSAAHAHSVDTAAPIVAMGSAPGLIRAAKVSFDWSAVDAGSGLATYVVRTRRALGGQVGAWSAPRPMSASTRGVTTLTVRPGEQLCVQVRAVDAAGNASDWTLPTCTSRFADDRTAKAGAGWHHHRGHGASRHTLSTAGRKHAVLRLGQLAAGRLGVVRSGKGALVVRVAGHRVGTLRGAGTTWLTLPRAGKVTLTTATSRRVTVDAFVLVPRFASGGND